MVVVGFASSLDPTRKTPVSYRELFLFSGAAIGLALVINVLAPRGGLVETRSTTHYNWPGNHAILEPKPE